MESVSITDMSHSWNLTPDDVFNDNASVKLLKQINAMTMKRNH